MKEIKKTTRIFLLRGLARESRHWGDFLGKMSEAFSPAILHPLDIPGTGQLHGQVSPTSVKEYIKIMRQEYLNHTCQDDACKIIGLSLGGMIAAQWLDSHPEDFDSAVLINSSSRLSPFFKRMIISGALQLLKAMITFDPLRREKILASLLCNLADREKTARHWAEIHKTAPVSILNILRQLFAATTFKPPQNLTTPVLLLCSTNDRLVSAKCSEDIAMLWHKDMVCHDRAGHDLPTDDPDWCVSALQSWQYW